MNATRRRRKKKGDEDRGYLFLLAPNSSDEKGKSDELPKAKQTVSDDAPDSAFGATAVWRFKHGLPPEEDETGYEFDVCEINAELQIAAAADRKARRGLPFPNEENS